MSKKWCVEKEIKKEIPDIPLVVLNILIERFYGEKWAGRKLRATDSLKEMLTALDSHLKDNGYNASVIRDREFSSSKQVLEEKAEQLPKAGFESNKKAKEVSAKEVEEVKVLKRWLKLCCGY